MEQIDLKALEKRAFKSTFEDGIWDIYLGLLVLNMSIFPWLVGSYMSIRAIIITACIIVGAALFIFFWGKKKITTPRLGLIKFGAPRKARLRKVKMVLLLSLILGTILLASTRMFGAIAGIPTVIIVFCANAILVFSIGAYFLNVTRFYAYGVLLAVPFPLGFILMEHEVSRILVVVLCSIPSLLMLCIGSALLLNFMKKYPKMMER